MKLRSFFVSAVYFLGLVLLYVGERMLTSGAARWLMTGLGLAGVVTALIWRGVRLSHSSGDAARAEKLLLVLYGIGLIAILLYFVQSDVTTGIFGKPFDQRFPKMTGIFAVAWPVLICASFLPTLLAELAYASMVQAPVIEFGRVVGAVWSGLGLSGALVFAFALCYVATQRDRKVDLSYMRTAKPGDSTRKIVRGLDEEVQVSVFFPPANEVRSQVLEYFTGLAKESPKLKVSSYDKDVDLTKAKELGVSGNGAIVLSRGSRKEQLVLTQRIESARSELANFDQEVQKRLLGVARARRVLYFTSGHGERAENTPIATDQRSTIASLKELVRSQNYEVRTLSAVEGLGTEIPKDAAAIFILGPTHSFLPEELNAISRYLDGGGRVLLAVDPETPVDFKPLLQPLGLDVMAGATLANDRAFLTRSHQPSDRSILLTASYSFHPSVTTLSQLGQRAPLIFIGASALELRSPKPADVTIDFTVHAHPLTWADKNGNFEFDAQQEVRKAWELAAAVVKRKPAPAKDSESSRLLVIGDSDLLTDIILSRSPGNAYFALDGLRWLVGDDNITGEVASEVDRPIQHTRKQDVAWFYSTIFLAPALVLLVGLLPRRKRSARGSAR